VLVTKLGVDNVLYEGEVDASNWMSALRAAREGMAERPSVPPGVSCSIDGQGVATVLDPGSRRRFLLSPGRTGASPAANANANANSAPKPQAQSAAAPAARIEPHYPPVEAKPTDPPPAPAPAPTTDDPARPARSKRFQTVAFMPEHLVERPVAVGGSPSSRPEPAQPQAQAVAAPAAAPMPAPAAAAPTPAQANKKKKFDTVGFSPAMHGGAPDPAPRDRAPAAPPERPPSAPVSGPGRASMELEQLFERNEEPSTDNPLLYCERAYLLPRNSSVPDAEAALRWKLADIQRDLESRKRGKLVNLAVFDHRWTDVPDRPPVITLQWRDWRSEVVVDYPAAARASSAPPSMPPASGGHDDRLADVFEALGTLSRLPTAADALDFSVKLIERTVLSQAVSACLYDINTDELRFVAVTGIGAASMQGRAVPRTAGLFAQAARLEHHASVFKDLMAEPAYDPAIDSRPGLDAINMLLRPIVFEHQLLGMLQLINRREKPSYTAEDAHLVSYVAERLAEYVNNQRRRRSQPPKS
jgi:hypothetical protein